MKVERLVVGKGRTTKPSDAEEWLKEYYEVEVAIEDPAELEVAKANLTGLIDGWLSSVRQRTTGNQKAPASAPVPQLDAAQFFPEDIRSLLSFEQKADMVIIKPRQFLGSENFAKIADIIKKHGGDYVSAGKGSHFRIPSKSS